MAAARPTPDKRRREQGADGNAAVAQARRSARSRQTGTPVPGGGRARPRSATAAHKAARAPHSARRDLPRSMSTGIPS